MIVAAQSIRLPVCFGLHRHPFSSWLPDPKSPADITSRRGVVPFHRIVFVARSLLLNHSPVVRHDRQVQPVWRKLYGGDLVLPIIVKVVAVGQGNRRCLHLNLEGFGNKNSLTLTLFGFFITNYLGVITCALRLCSALFLNNADLTYST